jgi:hypothetical protein
LSSQSPLACNMRTSLWQWRNKKANFSKREKQTKKKTENKKPTLLWSTIVINF